MSPRNAASVGGISIARNTVSPLLTVCYGGVDAGALAMLTALINSRSLLGSLPSYFSTLPLLSTVPLSIIEPLKIPLTDRANSAATLHCGFSLYIHERETPLGSSRHIKFIVNIRISKIHGSKKEHVNSLRPHCIQHTTNTNTPIYHQAPRLTPVLMSVIFLPFFFFPPACFFGASSSASDIACACAIISSSCRISFSQPWSHPSSWGP
jgi:hypothetical protein